MAPVDLLLRLMDVADSARASRLEAEASGTAVQRARSADLEVKVLGALLGQYGIDATSTAQALKDAEQLVRAIGRYTTMHPTAARDLIAQIRTQGLGAFADDLDSIASRNHLPPSKGKTHDR